ncbi:MAG TPA: DUF6569 family protein [Blastocatellia bacterium]|nr:DUF6569 family protein [Blastocatellia bacterium]
MKRIFQSIGAVSLLVTIAVATQALRQQVSNPQTGDTQTKYRITGPYTHNNLTIFLIHGPDKIRGLNMLTLPEALEQHKVIVHETGDVNQLAIENVSDSEVFVQAGDIVKGGKQDRCMGVDLIVPPRSGRMPVAAFCVENGRWQRRGTEGSASFAASPNMLASKDIKLAAKSKQSQGDVWNTVAQSQTKLSNAAGAEVRAETSATSMELSLENKTVQVKTEDYIKALDSITKSDNDILGYVFAINGNINSADIYPTNALFKKLWPRLLKASATEAFSESSDQTKPHGVTTDMVERFLADADKGTESEKEVTKRVRMVTRESSQNVLFETTDGSRKNQWVHRNYIAK